MCARRIVLHAYFVSDPAHPFDRLKELDVHGVTSQLPVQLGADTFGQACFHFLRKVISIFQFSITFNSAHYVRQNYILVDF